MPGKPEHENDGYAEDGKASGADSVFKSRLPQPVRISSRGDPIEAERALMKLVLEPVSTALSNAASNMETGLAKAIAQLTEGVSGIVAEQATLFQKAVSEVEQGFASVFPGLSINLDIRTGPPKFDAAKLIADGSGLRVTDSGAEVQLSQQGAGAQRALFWTMLRVHNRLVSDKKAREKKVKELEKELKAQSKNPGKAAEIDLALRAIKDGGALPAEVDDPALPGYILLIDEPENALHPLAARAAQRQLYLLAEQPEWQVMMTTHSPLFVNPTMDHTTILRVERDGGMLSPRTFRTDEANFNANEKESLKAIQEMDPTFCEVFFGSHPILVEGDTEHAAFIAAIAEEGHELIDEVTIIKARGKPQLLAIIKMLIHFRKDFGILHDSDWPLAKDRKTNKDGSFAKSGSWAHNKNIRKLVNEAKRLGIRVSHRVSIPDFERQIGLPRGSSGKPFEAYTAVKQAEEIKGNVQAILSELREPETYADGKAIECDADVFVASLLNELRENAKKYNWEDGDRLGD